MSMMASSTCLLFKTIEELQLATEEDGLPSQWDQRKASRANYAGLPRHSLVLCASLVHNPANLGGLCRLAEVFRLEALILPSLAIAQDPAFRKTAVSAHHWQPVLECSPQTLEHRLDDYRQQNYQVIGLDSAAHPPPLMTFPFSQRTVMVLGQELTGLPTSIIQRCNHVVTIPQYGLVESLNVQHAGAIAIYEYLKQHGLKE
jgi:tRNA guanosine-2'-O-methyltransferase